MTKLVRFAYDSSISVLINRYEKEYFDEMSTFVNWRDASYPHINVSKTKVMFFDFRRDNGSVTQLKMRQLRQQMNTYILASQSIAN